MRRIGHVSEIPFRKVALVSVIDTTTGQVANLAHQAINALQQFEPPGPK